MAYAAMTDVAARTGITYTTAEINRGTILLEDAAVMIDEIAPYAGADAKRVVSCRMVIRAMEDPSEGVSLPTGANQGSMAAGGYSQSWTITGGGTGELYIGKTERQILGCGRLIGSYSPTEGLVVSCD
jgi:hypothetical protein